MPSNSVRIVVVVYDTALNQERFGNMLARLHKEGRLVRFVIDEGHEVFGSAAYRPVMTRLFDLRIMLGSTVSFSILSGTLNLPMANGLVQAFSLERTNTEFVLEPFQG